MALFKCTALFSLTTGATDNEQPQRTAGWSESFYSDLASFADIQSNFKELCRLRAKMLPPACKIVGQRYQQVNPVGRAQTSAAIYPGAAGTATDIPQMALFIKLPAASTNNFRPTYLRGLPDARVVLGEFEPSLFFSQALTQWNVRATQFKFRAIDQVTFNYPLFQISQAGVFFTDGAHALVAGDKVSVLRALDDNGNQVGGKFRVIAPITSDSGVVDGWTFGACVGGRIRKNAIIYPQIGLLDLQQLNGRVVTKKVGAPSAKYRGRVSKKRKV